MVLHLFYEILCPSADSPQSKPLARICIVPWVAASQRKAVGVCGFTVEINVKVCTINDGLGIQERNTLSGPLRCKCNGWVEIVNSP